MKQEHIYSPLEGTIMKLEDSPDKVFAGGMLGRGVAIDPSSGNVYSPVDGTILMVFHTKHAIGIKTKQDNEILIHFGVDTVKLNGKGFTIKVKENQEVKRGDLLLSVNIKKVAKKVSSLVTPITITNSGDVKVMIIKSDGTVSNNDHIITIEKE
jgi:glucose-specific phosphotransferase system IIA component